jgi:hypothetical protein
MGNISLGRMSIDDPDLMERILEERITAAKRRRQKEEGREWQRFYTVVPRAWELQLQKAKRASTYRLALELLYLWWRPHPGKGKPITVSGTVAKAAGLSARSKSRSLAELEYLDLVRVTRKPRKSPRATLKHTFRSGKIMGQIGPHD